MASKPTAPPGLPLAQDFVLAADPVRFAKLVNFTPDPWQAQLLRTDRRRVVVLSSRQTGKSDAISLKALHRALFFPGVLVLIVSASQRQSDETFAKILMRLNAFGDVLDGPPETTEQNKRSLRLKNTSRIVSLPDSPGKVRSFSKVGLLIIDEAAFVSEAMYRAVSPMLAVGRGQQILLSTPFGKRGSFYTAYERGEPVWEQIGIKATECSRISPEFLEEERQTYGDLYVQQEYLCAFLDLSSAFFSTSDVSAAFREEVEPLFAGERALPTAAEDPMAPLFSEEA